MRRNCLNFLSTLKTSVGYFRSKDKCEGFLKFLGNEKTIVAQNEFLKSEQKVQWLIDGRKGRCLKAEGDLSAPQIIMDNPGCFFNTAINSAALLNPSNRVRVSGD